PGVRNVRDNWGGRAKSLDVRMDPVRLRLSGITNQHVASSLLQSLSGFEASELRIEDDKIPIVLRAQGRQIRDLSALRNLTIFGSGRTVALQQVADIDLTLDYTRIRRTNRVRTVQVSADVEPGARPKTIQSDALEAANAAGLGGAVFEPAGEQEKSAEATQKLLANAPAAGLIIMMLLILQFNSFRRMVINVVVLPFALIGVVPALLMFDSAFGFLALLAMIGLFGILLNNGIVLIDRIDIEIAAGRSPAEAVIEASVARARPIAITVITTISGLIPLYLGGGSAFEGMAMTLMGGLAGGTVLTLILVPVVYAILFRVRPSAPAASTPSEAQPG
ncbi:MAG: multidrug efflux pump subunit AcrB, partial [Kiritimatiellia bacterium]